MSGMSRLRMWLRGIFSVVYLVVFAECFLRIFAPVAVFPRYVTAGPHGIRVNEPNRKYWHVSADVRVEIRTNSKGIRADREFSYECPPDVKRIVVLGDSFAMGYEASLEGMYTTHMENLLKENGITVEVVNLAVSGHSNAEELIAFREEGAKYHPDLVLLCWHSTDLEENVRSALFELKGQELTRANPSYLPGVMVQQKLCRIPGYEWVSSNSQLYSWAREGIATRVAKPGLLFLQQLRQSPSQGESLGETDIVPKSDEYAEKLAVSLLREIDKEVRLNGGKLVVLDIPNIGDDDLVASAFPKDEGLRREIPVISPTEEFAGYRARELIHLKSHRHFTPKACRLVGEVLAKEIAAIENWPDVKMDFKTAKKVERLNAE